MSSSESSAPDDNSDSDPEFIVDEQPDRVHGRRSSSRAEALTISSDEEIKYGILSDSDSDASHNQFETLHDRIKHVPPNVLDAYTSLVTEIEQDITFSAIKESDEIHNVHQNGAVVWTASEKEILYNVLDRKGKNGIKEISTAIGTKSELEVMDHLRLLHRGVESQNLLERHVRTIVMGDVPAAAEISKECCAELDEYAGVLRAKEELAAAPVARMRYGDNWIVTGAQAQQLLEAEMDVPMRGSIHLAANLFNVPTWIELEQRFFMNFGGSQEADNWVNIVQSKDESPSISGDALMDFYALTVSITRRLIQSAQFIAMARLRSMRRNGRERSNAVRRKDVKAAINVLNMKPNRSDFLLRLARRNDLVIEDRRKRKGWKTRTFDHDEAERILNGEDDYFQRVNNTALPNRVGDAEDNDDDEDESDGEESRQHSRMTSQQSSELSSPFVSSDEEVPFDSEEEHANTLDQDYSRREELNLWQLLEKPAPPTLEATVAAEENDINASRKPTAERKLPEDMAEWRDRILYRSEWEEYGYDVGELENALVGNRRKRRRIEEEAPMPLSASVVNSEDDAEADVADVAADEAEEESPPQLGAEKNTRVEPPKYGTAGWDAFLQSFLTQTSQYTQGTPSTTTNQPQ
ncbi:uncharacterized protein N7482_002434 [Penicillium canariense]|uniref:Myb-like domain-containing protein n=1 Tax=Penicillium canariense TaxID=189055 RepID=A0A9W9IHK2_9EURO|nr:uncharacterized protein N7482_002434 [Penicillium canariense]KAJ5176557.1 hypothetical protein N7482_002434 [Penicillium canariense]